MAVVVAWGAKFSEHPLFTADRFQNRNQSAFAKVLINRARDLAEDMKVHRVPTADHVVIGLLIEPLQSRECGSVPLPYVICNDELVVQRAWRTMQVCYVFVPSLDSSVSPCPRLPRVLAGVGDTVAAGLAGQDANRSLTWIWR